jgi:hypothetical protein
VTWPDGLIRSIVSVATERPRISSSADSATQKFPCRSAVHASTATNPGSFSSESARHDPGAPFAGKFIAISDGQVVAQADDLDGLVQRLHQIDAELGPTLCLEVGIDHNHDQEIWGSR